MLKFIVLPAFFAVSNCLLSQSSEWELDWKIDSTFYEQGELKSVVYSKKPSKVQEISTSNQLLNTGHLETKIFHYDQCGNLRNTRSIYRYDNPYSKEMLGILGNEPRFEIIDNELEQNCEYKWVKPLFND